MSAPEVSHGRGGAGNINPDETKYVDGEVVRVGVAGSHGDGAFSTGRGGKDVEHLPLPPTPSQSLRLCRVRILEYLHLKHKWCGVPGPTLSSSVEASRPTRCTPSHRL